MMMIMMVVVMAIWGVGIMDYSFLLGVHNVSPEQVHTKAKVRRTLIPLKRGAHSKVDEEIVSKIKASIRKNEEKVERGGDKGHTSKKASQVEQHKEEEKEEEDNDDKNKAKNTAASEDAPPLQESQKGKEDSNMPSTNHHAAASQREDAEVMKRKKKEILRTTRKSRYISLFRREHGGIRSEVFFAPPSPPPRSSSSTTTTASTEANFTSTQSKDISISTRTADMHSLSSSSSSSQRPLHPREGDKAGSTAPPPPPPLLHTAKIRWKAHHQPLPPRGVPDGSKANYHAVKAKAIHRAAARIQFTTVPVAVAALVALDVVRGGVRVR